MMEPLPITTVNTCASTHDLAVELCGDNQRLMIVQAASQTAGRGRAGRLWVDDGGKGGSLLLTVVVRDLEGVSRLDGLSVRSAQRIVDALTDCGARDLRVKDPNDIVTVRNEKVGGLLVDAVTQGDRVQRVVMSIGLNVTWAPNLPDRATASIHDVGVVMSIEAIAQRVAAALIASVTT